MISLKDFFDAVGYRISEGSDFSWRCYGNSAFQLDVWNGDHDGHSASVVFDLKSQLVYEISVCDYARARAYRWINPDYRDAFMQESQDMHDANIAWDCIKFVDLEVAEDIMQKTKAIVQGLDYDTRIVVPLDLDRDTLFELMSQAHEQDMTLNQMVQHVLQNMIDNQHNWKS